MKGSTKTGSLPEYLTHRYYNEPDCPTRTPFTRDRDRILHTKAFRRLQHKTQAFIAHEGDHYRSRLTHSLEVAQVGRSISRRLGLDQDLTEAMALAHDLGHPPFGHAGERALQRVMRGRGGFDHNLEGLRIITWLEKRYPFFNGLNLTFATLEGLLKHNGALDKTAMERVRDFVAAPPFDRFESWPVMPEAPAFPEAAVAALADDIAYNVHDLDDGLRAGLIMWDDLTKWPVIGDIKADIDRISKALEPARRFSELHRRLLTTLINDVVQTAKRPTVIRFSSDIKAAVGHLKANLFDQVYCLPTVAVLMERAESVTEELFQYLDADPKRLPDIWYHDWQDAGDQAGRVICDFLAGMTDRYALKFYENLGGTVPVLTLNA